MRKYMKKTDEARLQGMELAYKIAKERGIEDLEKEIKWRGAHNVSLTVPRQELIMISREIAKEEFMLVAVSMAMTITGDMHMPPSITKDYLTKFNDRMDLYRDDKEQFEKDTALLNSDFAMLEMVKKYTEERDAENE